MDSKGSDNSKSVILRDKRHFSLTLSNFQCSFCSIIAPVMILMYGRFLQVLANFDQKRQFLGGYGGPVGGSKNSKKIILCFFDPIDPENLRAH